MRLPISKRLLCCAELIDAPCRVADIGTDHGYLGIHLLSSGKADYIVAADLRQGPLDNAIKNAKRFAMMDRMRFVLSDGLRNVDADEIDTIVCAGMGGELIIRILENCPWIFDAKYRLILQPQATPHLLRAWLADKGFSIEREIVCHDGRFYYTVLRARFGERMILSEGQQYITPQLLREESELVPAFIDQTIGQLEKTVNGMRSAREVQESRLAFYAQALEEIKAMRDAL